MRLRRSLLLVTLALASTATPAADWRWLSSFTPTSDKGLVALHEELNAPRLDGVQGVLVQNLHWREELFDLHLKSGTVYLEPPVQGAAVGAFFVGEGEVAFRPTTTKAREDMDFWFGKEKLEAEPISHAYFFTLRGQNLVEQLGVDAEPSVSFEAKAAYEESKLALRQLGTTFLHAFLNREGRGQGASWVLFPMLSLRGKGSKSAYLLYSFDLGREDEIHLAAFGHDEVESRIPHKHYFRSLVWCRAVRPRAEAHGRAIRYSTRLDIQGSFGHVEEETTLTFEPREGVAALRLALAPRLEVGSVTGPKGGRLSFVQWKHLTSDPNYDAYLAVSFGSSLEAGKPVDIRIASSGTLFEPFGKAFWLADEDDWHPRLDDAGGAEYELFVTVPRAKQVVAAGRLLEEVVDGRERRYHFRTSRPHKRTTLYYGDFESMKGKADETEVEVFISESGDEAKNLKFAVAEVGNMVRVFNRLFVPLEMDHLRVAGTPTRHGRGFEGLILLSQRAGFSGASSGADVFRAHEVAHQWWGNMVQPRLWPDDRWLSESFAEYAAMEYYTIRFEKPEKTRQEMYEEWIMPLVGSPRLEVKTLTGERRKEQISEISPLIDGGQNVYTKGPMVLHMLRYLFKVQKGSDEGFWELLREFLKTHKYQEATTEDFTKLAGQRFGADLKWFWDQWVYGSEIPEVRWTHKVEPSEGGRWVLSLDAQQEGSAYRLHIPVYIHFKGDRIGVKPLVVNGSTGRARMALPEQPVKVTLNDNFEALVRLKD